MGVFPRSHSNLRQVYFNRTGNSVLRQQSEKAMPVPVEDNMFDIPIGVVNQETCKVHGHDRVRVRRDVEVGEVMKPLEARYPGSYITLNNKLTQLQEDDILSEVYQEGDVLTGLKMKHNIERNGVKWCDKPSGDVVVLSNIVTKQHLVVETKNEQIFQFKPKEYAPVVSIFWKQYDDVPETEEEEEERRHKKEKKEKREKEMKEEKEEKEKKEEKEEKQEGDVLTGLKMKHNIERNGVKWC